MKNLQPLYDKILVKLTKETSKTIGGIYIPSESVEKPQTGKVIKTGKGKLSQSGELIPLTVKVDDLVYFGKYAGAQLPDEEYVILREDEVIGILE